MVLWFNGFTVMEEKKYLKLNDISAYKKALKISNHIWSITCQWNYFQKSTVGIQYVRSIDSVSANIAEGYGRFYKKEKIQFFRYAMGSVIESMDWTQKSFDRTLITKDQYNNIMVALKELPRSINGLIKYYNNRLTK